MIVGSGAEISQTMSNVIAVVSVFTSDSHALPLSTEVVAELVEICVNRHFSPAATGANVCVMCKPRPRGRRGDEEPSLFYNLLSISPSRQRTPPSPHVFGTHRSTPHLLRRSKLWRTAASRGISRSVVWICGKFPSPPVQSVPLSTSRLHAPMFQRRRLLPFQQQTIYWQRRHIFTIFYSSCIRF